MNTNSFDTAMDIIHPVDSFGFGSNFGHELNVLDEDWDDNEELRLEYDFNNQSIALYHLW